MSGVPPSVVHKHSQSPPLFLPLAPTSLSAHTLVKPVKSTQELTMLLSYQDSVIHIRLHSLYRHWFSQVPGVTLPMRTDGMQCLHLRLLAFTKRQLYSHDTVPSTLPECQDTDHHHCNNVEPHILTTSTQQGPSLFTISSP